MLSMYVNALHMGAVTIKGAKVIVKCSVILYHVYFERQICVMYLQLYLFVNDLDLQQI